MINKESTKAGVIVMAMTLAMFALAGILAKGCERIDATWEEQYPTEVREVAARGVGYPLELHWEYSKSQIIVRVRNAMVHG